eukprot:6193161-Pleurochrysis_carterae.AAC.1
MYDNNNFITTSVLQYGIGIARVLNAPQQINTRRNCTACDDRRIGGPAGLEVARSTTGKTNACGTAAQYAPSKCSSQERSPT